MSIQVSSETNEVDQLAEEELHGYLLEVLASAVDPRELRRRGNSGLEGIARSATTLFADLAPGQIKITLSSPGGDRMGRTTIELLMLDRPFIFDTFRMVLRRLGLREKFTLHSVLAVEREADGSVVAVGKSVAGNPREAYVYAEVPLIKDAAVRSQLEAELEKTFIQVRNVVRDHGRMVKVLQEHTSKVAFDSSQLDTKPEIVDELRSFLDWLADGNFVFFGYRYYDVSCQGEGWKLELDPSSGLGLLREAERSRFIEATIGGEIPAVIRARFARDGLVFFDKSRSQSTIHRGGRLDCIGIKTLDADGRLVGFGKFIGLLTYKATRARGSSIPTLSRRRERVLREIGAEPGSHTYKAAIEAYDLLPVEFLFSCDIEDTIQVVQRIVLAAENTEVDVCVVPNLINRSFFVSVILPRSLYDEDLRRDLQKLLTQQYGAIYVDNRTSFLDDEVALIHFFCDSGEDLDLEMLAGLECDIKARATSWGDRFEAALVERHSSELGCRLAEEYDSAFPKEYRIVTSADDAALDVEYLERLRRGEVQVDLNLTADAGQAGSLTSRLKVYHRERPYLTDLLPLLDNFGLRVIDATLTQVSCASECQLWIVTFRTEKLPANRPSLFELETAILGGLRAALTGRVGTDSLNRLVLGARLSWQQVELVRAYLAYSRQLGTSPGRGFASEVLLNHPAPTRALLALFQARLDPDLKGDREAAEAQALAGLVSARESIRTANEDRVFGLLANLIQSTVRTNFFALVPEVLGAVAFKIDPSQVKMMPSPRPRVEVFVHSAEMNGVHLRAGLVARGGIRWSDRIQDFRAEVLGLMKTQRKKNGLIVPSGAKGGFVLKRRFSDPSLARQEADRQYACFIQALLEVTDNIVDEKVVPPQRVVRHDGDDTYLVVAADKGTAHLSDVANQVAEASGFWMGDAFASGGSSGYDHKKEGITAWGAWVCVKRHFLELGIDVENELFTAVGIGDMSGDVFGNGLLLARRCKLLAAFNHVHIFLDPDPDPEVAWTERKRLFELPQSTWRDYDTSKISRGGGVFERAARAVHLTPQMKEVLDLDIDVLSGEELIRAILRMPVDLLWNGGVGTYVKASTETHAEVGDRANSSVRVDARDLRTRVIGEGGNLGLTQLGRVEYALGGGRLNTDAIDNSGGVELSDYEVNFKILLASRCEDARMSVEERKRILRGCVGEANAAVVAHSASQSRCISMDLLRSRCDPERIFLAADFLEQHADLDPALEFLPSREALNSRTGTSDIPSGYTRPELAILLGYTKMLTKREMVTSDILDHHSLNDVLMHYFPESLREAFREDIEGHRLRRQITATCLANQVVDQAGVTLVPDLVRAFGIGVADVILAYHTVGELLEADRLRLSLESQSVSETARLEAMLRIAEAVRIGTFIFIALERRIRLEPCEFACWVDRVRSLRELEAGSPDDSEALVAQGFGPETSVALAQISRVAGLLGAVSLSIRCDVPLSHVVEGYAAIGTETGADWLLERLQGLDHHEAWDRIACDALRLEVLETQHALTARVLACGNVSCGLADFLASNDPALKNIQRMVQQIDASERVRSAPLTVLSQHLRRLC